MKSRILAHRGHWTLPAQKNTLEALERAFAGGYGVETDIRDLEGTLVISHDPPRTDNILTADRLFATYARMRASGWLALNIKSDGLASQLQALLDHYEIQNAFVFDMSVPDLRSYLSSDIRAFTRRSDKEPLPSYYEKCEGLWLDSFEIPFSPSKWASEALADGKNVALVSPELHSRPYLGAWEEWRVALSLSHEERGMICTDFPDEAATFFMETSDD